MWNLVLFVLNDPTKLDEVLEAWVAAGVRGATIVESTGMARRRGYLGDDVPLFPSISTLMQSSESTHRTIFAVVGADLPVETLVACTEAIVGDLGQPHTGILVATPLSYAKGVRSG